MLKCLFGLLPILPGHHFRLQLGKAEIEIGPSPPEFVVWIWVGERVVVVVAVMVVVVVASVSKLGSM